PRRAGKQLGQVMPYHGHARARRADHVLAGGEGVQEAGSHCSCLFMKPAVESRLPAARLPLGEVHRDSKPLEQPHGALADLGVKRVNEACHQQRHPHASTLLCVELGCLLRNTTKQTQTDINQTRTNTESEGNSQLTEYYRQYTVTPARPKIGVCASRRPQSAPGAGECRGAGCSGRKRSFDPRPDQILWRPARGEGYGV